MGVGESFVYSRNACIFTVNDFRRSRTLLVLAKAGFKIRYKIKFQKSHPMIGGPSMSFRCCASVVLALVVSACASSPDTPLGGEFETSAAASQGNSRLIVRAQFEQLAGQSAWWAVETLNPRRLQARTVSVNYGPSYARVVVDGTVRGELAELYRMNTDNIETMRYLSASDATTRYGTGYLGGVIEVTMRRGR